MRRKIPELIRDFFDISAARDGVFLKNKAMSFVRNGLVKVDTEIIVQREHQYITTKQDETLLFNALLLSAFFTDPKYVNKIFFTQEVREEAAELVHAILCQRQTVLGVALLNLEALELVKQLKAVHTFNLSLTRLANPFSELPQLVLNKNIALMPGILAQSASLDAADSLLSAYEQQDWHKAHEFCNQLEQLDELAEGTQVLIKAVRQRIREADQFDDLLDFFSQR